MHAPWAHANEFVYKTFIQSDLSNDSPPGMPQMLMLSDTATGSIIFPGALPQWQLPIAQMSDPLPA
jgi:hypothetical protein